MNVTIIALVMLLLPVLQWKTLKRSGRWQDIGVYAGVWLLASCCAIFAGTGFMLLRPFEWIKVLLSPVVRLLG